MALSIFGYKVQNPTAARQDAMRSRSYNNVGEKTQGRDKTEENKAKRKAAGEASGGAYVTKRRRDGEYRADISADARADAERLGIDLPDRGPSGNRMSVTNRVKKFNEALNAARDQETADAEVAVEDDTSLSTDDLDADDGIGSVADAMEGVEAAADTNVTGVDAGGNTSDGSELTAEQQAEIAAIASAADTSGAEQAAAASGSYEAVASGLSGDSGFTAGGVDNDSFTGSAAGGAAEADIAEVISESEEEDEAIDSYRQGRRSTIATSAQGLLSSAPTRPVRSLMGGMIV